MSLDPQSLSNLSRSLDRRLALGRIAVLNGLLSPDDFEEAVREARASGKPLGAVLVSRRLITAEQLASLLKEEALLECGGTLPESVGEVVRMVGRYALVENVGSGGGGVVWKAWDTRLERWVALKEPRLSGKLARERFQREARVAARVKHPNLIPVFEAGELDGADFLVMDFVEGRPLDHASLDPRAATEVLARTCDAAEALHAEGIVHRDIKPQNILLDAMGTPHLGDFGLAKLLEGQPLTVEGGFLGTPQYVAPEQAAGRLGEIGAWTDVYGLGATLYHLLSGHAPFDGEEPATIVRKKIEGETPASLERVPADLALIVRRAMETRPADRYPTAAALAGDLRRFLRGESPLIRPVGATRRAWTWTRRRFGRIAVAIAVAAAVAGVWAYHRATRRDAAYETARQKGDELWARAVGLLRGGDRAATRSTLEEALRRFRTAAAEGSDRPYPWLMEGRCLMLLGRPGEAQEAWARALDRDPAHGPALLERAKYRLSSYARLRLEAPASESSAEAEWRAKGERDLEAARRAKGLEASSLGYLQGMLHLGGREFEKAAAAFRAYMAENPWDAAGLAVQGAAEYYAGRLEEAEATWTRVVALDPRAEAHASRGRVRFRRGRFADAVADFDESLRLDAANPEAWCDRGAARQALGLLNEAVSDYSRAILLRSSFARAYANRGTAHAERKDYAAAHEDFLEAQRQSPFFVEAYVNRGITFLKQGNAQEAADEFGAALEIDPRRGDVFGRRGLCRMLLLDFEGAIRDFTQGLYLVPQDPDLLLQRGQARFAARDSSVAIEDVKEALRVAPETWPRKVRAEELLREWEKAR